MPECPSAAAARETDAHERAGVCPQCNRTHRSGSKAQKACIQKMKEADDAEFAAWKDEREQRRASWKPVPPNAS